MTLEISTSDTENSNFSQWSVNNRSSGSVYNSEMLDLDGYGI